MGPTLKLQPDPFTVTALEVGLADRCQPGAFGRGFGKYPDATSPAPVGQDKPGGSDDHFPSVRYVPSLPAVAGVWEWDLLSDRVYIDEAIENVLGYEGRGEDWLYSDWEECVSLQDRAAVRTAMESLRNGDSAEFQLVHGMSRSGGGSARIWSRAVCRHGADGRPVRVIGTHVVMDGDGTEQQSWDPGPEGRYALLAEHSTDLVTTHDRDGRYRYVSPASIHLLGYEPEQLVGTDPGNLIHPDDLTRFAAYRLSVDSPQARNPETLAYRIGRSGGTHVWVESSCTPIRSRDGRQGGFVCVTRDITAQRQTEEQLRDSEARFRILTELSADWYWEQDSNGRYIEVSDGYVQRSGMRPASVLGRTRWEVPGMMTSDSGRAALDALYRDRQPFRDVTITYRAEDGSLRMVAVSGTPILDAAGDLQGYRGVGRDITEQESMRQAVIESEQRMRLALEYGNVGVWEWDQRVDVIRCSPDVGPMFGYSPGTIEIASKDVFDRIHPLDRERLGVKPSGVSEALLEQGFEHRVVWPCGTVRWVFKRGRVLTTPDGHERRIGIVQDVTERKEVEIALRVSEERFRVLTDLSSDYYWEQDAEFRFTAFRRGGFGDAPRRDDKAIGKTPWEVDNIEPPVEGWVSRKAFLERHLPFRDEVRTHRGPNGEVRTLLVSGYPAFDMDGKFEGYRGVSKDITRQEDQHRRLRESEARFRALTELSSDWYWEQDEQLRFTVISENYYRLTKRPIGTCLGKTRAEIDPDSMTAEIAAAYDEAVTARKPYYDLLLRRTDGHGRTRAYLTSGMPIFDNAGRFRGYRGVAKDVTETKLAEDALRESEHRFRLLAECTRDAIWISDPHITRLDYLNPAFSEVWGLSADEAKQRPGIWMDLIHPEDLERAKAALLRQIEGNPVDVEVRIVRRDGELRWLWVRTNPARDNQGTPIVCGITEDVTRRKLEQLQHLEEAARQRDALVREVHHRIKNSLQGVAGLLRSHAHRDRRSAAYLELAIAQIQAIATIHGLQGMGRTGGVDVVRVAEAIVKMLENLTQKRIHCEGLDTIERRLTLAEEEAVATALILNEIIVNAIKHQRASDDGQSVSVRFQGHEQGMDISVSNFGTLPAGFALDQREGLGTGLELVCALMPKKGLTLQMDAKDGWVTTVLRIGTPVVVGLNN